MSFTSTVQNLLNHKINFLHTDCGGEYASNEFNSFCITNGITHEYTCPHTSQQNGLAERKHRHIVDIALTLISQFSLPLSFWPYAFNIAVFLINRLPSSIPNRNSPWELLFKTCSSYESLLTFGYLCYPLLRPYNSHKLQPRSVVCVSRLSNKCQTLLLLWSQISEVLYISSCFVHWVYLSFYTTIFYYTIHSSFPYLA